MKRILMIAAVAAASMLAFSCSKDDNGGDVDEGTFDTPAMKDEARILNLASGSIPVKYIEFTEGGYYLVKEIVTKASEDAQYYFGKFTKNGDTYNLSGYGTVTLSGSGSSVEVAVKKTDNTEYNGTASVSKGASSDIGDKLFRTWTVTKTRVSITEGVKANADFNGCNLGEIAAFLRNQGVNVPDAFEGVSATSITISSAGSYIICYNNSRIDRGACNFSSLSSNGTFTYVWESSEMGYSFENGKGQVSFENGFCLLQVDADVKSGSKNYKTSVIFVMKDAK